MKTIRQAITDLDELLRVTWRPDNRDQVYAANLLASAGEQLKGGERTDALRLLRAVDKSAWLRSCRASALDVQQAAKLARVEASLSAAVSP